MRVKKTLVVNLANNSEQTFYNDLPAIENLVTAYLMDIGLTDNIHDPITRDKYRKKAVYGKVSVSIGTLAAIIIT